MGNNRISTEWTDATWQPITGCSVIGPGCTNCYAMTLAGTRLRHHPSRAGLTRDTKAGPVWTGEVRFNEQWLDLPLRWKLPRRIFVCAHGDLFHEAVPDEWIDRVFAVMALAPQHTFQVLTKRARRMRDYCRYAASRVTAAAFAYWCQRLRIDNHREYKPAQLKWPLPNVWLGVSVEDQPRADERIPLLLDTPAAKRFISAEPLLSGIDLREYLVDWATGWMLTPKPAIDWVIVGGENGPGARPMHPAWARSLRDQCQAAGVSFLMKQWGEWIDSDLWFAKLAINGVRFPVGDYLQTGKHLTWDEAARLAAATNCRDVEHQSDGTTLIRVGKRASGRLLDGRIWAEFPDD